MEYIKIEDNNYSIKDLEKVIEVIKAGGVVILPTETVYGVAADCLNEEAVKKIYKLKHRNYSKPCNILVSNIEMIKKVIESISEKEENVINNFFPGPLTIILKKNNMIPQIVTSNLDTIGIRMPDNKFLLELIEKYGRPIVATSLNISGEESMTTAQNIPQEITNQIDLVVDGGEAKIGNASTIIKIEDDEVKILREGPIKKEEIEKKIK